LLLLKLKKPAEADVAAIKAAIAIIFFIVFSSESLIVILSLKVV